MARKKEKRKINIKEGKIKERNIFKKEKELKQKTSIIDKKEGLKMYISMTEKKEKLKKKISLIGT